MKKENRHMAQQTRALKRKKQERHRKIKKFLSYFIPLAIILALIIVLLIDSFSTSRKTSDTEAAATGTESSQTASEDSPSNHSTADQNNTYSTDTSLSVENGDTVNIDYVGTVNGIEFEGGSTNGNGTDLTIGSGSYIDDFEEQLIGAHPGDEIQVEVTFPDNYSNADLQGQEAVFAVTINGIYK